MASQNAGKGGARKSATMKTSAKNEKGHVASGGVGASPDDLPVIKTDWRPDPERLKWIQDNYFSEKRTGRPPEYDPRICELVVLLGAEGLSYYGIIAQLGRAHETVRAWRAKHPELNEAFAEAKRQELAAWERYAVAGMFAPKFNAAVWIFSMKNRFREDYRDSHDHEVSSPGGGPLEIKDVTAMTPEERAAKIQEYMARHIATTTPKISSKNNGQDDDPEASVH